MAQVIGSTKDEAGTLKEKFVVKGLRDTDTHDILLAAMNQHRNIRNWEVKYDSVTGG
jgi:hypothetical protein